jgi:oxalate---CoA ligase
LSVASLVALRARTAGDQLALGVGRDGRVLSYAALERRTAAWAEALAGPAPAWSRRAGLAIDDPLDFAATYLSLLAAGVTVATLNPEAGADHPRQAGQLELDLVVTDLPAPPRGDCPVWHLADGVPRVGIPPASRPHWHAPEPPAVLLSSSGTTGTPKIVPLSERQLLAVAGRVAAHHRLGPGELGYSPLPLFHVNAQVVGLLSALASGAGLVLDRRFRRTGLWDLLASWRVTWLNAVPAVLAILADGPAPDEAAAARLRFARSASAPLPPAVQARFETRTGLSVLETYGMTEAASQVTANPLEPAARRPGSAGLPVGLALRVVDEQGAACPPGTTGSIEIRGPDVVEHYLEPGDGFRRLRANADSTVALRRRNPSGDGFHRVRAPAGSTPAPGRVNPPGPGQRLRDARNAAGWLVTGDVGHLDEDGYVFLTGRADDVINCGGEKMYPREIEDVLRQHPDVMQAAVVGQPDEVLGRCPVAYVTARPGAEPADLADALMRSCEARLGRSRRPRRLVVVDRVPTGPTGKVSRRQLEQDATRLRDLAVVERSRAS